VTAGIDPAAPGIESFKTQTGATISTDHQLSKAAILHLGECWPQCVGFPELLQGALRRLGAAASELRLAEEEARLAGLLFRAASGGHVGLHLSPPPLAASVSERPEASMLARKQALAGPVVTNQQHRTVLLEHEIVRHFLQLVDGTRTVDDLVTDLRHALRTAGNREADGNTGPDLVTRDSVEQNLALLVRMAVLVG
jgi:hypothetical protein